jgi:hypothetical protein
MSIGDVVIEAVEKVLYWDIPDGDLGRAAGYQAALMAKVDPDLIYFGYFDQIEL